MKLVIRGNLFLKIRSSIDWLELSHARLMCQVVSIPGEPRVYSFHHNLVDVSVFRLYLSYFSGPGARPGAEAQSVACPRRKQRSRPSTHSSLK